MKTDNTHITLMSLHIKELNLMNILKGDGQIRSLHEKFIVKGEKSLTGKYGLVPESPDFLHCEKPTFTDFITSLIFKIS